MHMALRQTPSGPQWKQYSGNSENGGPALHNNKSSEFSDRTRCDRRACLGLIRITRRRLKNFLKLSCLSKSLVGHWILYPQGLWNEHFSWPLLPSVQLTPWREKKLWNIHNLTADRDTHTRRGNGVLNRCFHQEMFKMGALVNCAGPCRSAL